jgi:serine/threonine protein kinase
MRLTSTNPAYDSWSLGLILWCLFTNNTYNSFTWREAVQETDYSTITKLKRDFVAASPWNDIPEPYRGLAKGLLNLDPKKRLTARQALSLLE